MTVGAFVTPDSVRQLQADVKADYDTLNAGVLRCNAASKLDDPTLTAWFAMQDRTSAFLKMAPSWLSTATQMDQGQALQKDLAAWHARLTQAGCDVGPAPTSADPGPGLFAGLQADIQQIGPLLLVAAVLFFLSKKGK